MSASENPAAKRGVTFRGMPLEADPPENRDVARRWWERYLPPAGGERGAFLILAAILLGLKVAAIYRYRSDADEMQHAHVIWGWTAGHLQYRDIFDNHMPLFHILFAPVMALLGERADIIVALRWMMLPLYLVSAWAVFGLTETLFSRRIAPWVALAAVALPKFFYTSTEFRPDDLWTVFWLLGLLVAVSGQFTVKRALTFGFLMGLAAAVTVKTAVLAVALVAAAVMALALARLRREGPGMLAIAQRLLAATLAAVIPPAAMVLYFTWRGAFWIMYYCVYAHNIVPGIKRWGDFSAHAWIFPSSVILLGGVAWLIFGQTRDTPLAMRRTIVLIVPWLYLGLLLSYMPDVTREDDLPYVPLTPLIVAPLLIWLAGRSRFPRSEAILFTWILPLLLLVELVWTWNIDKLRHNHMKGTAESIRDVLLLTKRDDDVMDRSGDSVFRMRPYYWDFETVTKERMRNHLIVDRLPQALVKTETKVCFLSCAHVWRHTEAFIMSNYFPCDPAAPDLGVAGKELGAPNARGVFSFVVVIPGTYAIVSETGDTGGELDGAPCHGPLRLEAGRHLFHRTSGEGHAAIFLGGALAAGFHPLFKESEKLLSQEKSPR